MHCYFGVVMITIKKLLVHSSSTDAVQEECVMRVTPGVIVRDIMMHKNAVQYHNVAVSAFSIA